MGRPRWCDRESAGWTGVPRGRLRFRHAPRRTGPRATASASRWFFRPRCIAAAGDHTPDRAASCPRRVSRRRPFRRIARTSRCSRSASSGRPLSCQSPASSAIASAAARASVLRPTSEAPSPARGAAGRDRRRRTVAVDAADEQHHVSLDFRLIRQLGLDSRGAAIPEIERGDLGSIGACGIGDLEEARNKAADLRALAASRDATRSLPRHPDQSADERQQHEHCCGHADGVASHELARRYRPSRGARRWAGRFDIGGRPRRTLPRTHTGGRDPSAAPS